MPVRPEKQPEVKEPDRPDPISTAKASEINPVTSILLTEQRTYGVVFVNEKGLKSFNDAERTTAFPEGSIIVRETRSAPDGIPSAVIVMFKRAKGFNPKGGDWEFVNLESPLVKIRQRQTTGSCLDCHSIREKHDFVFGKGDFPGHNVPPKSGDTP